MKKQFLLSIIVMIPSLGFAKISDFNALITENVKAQKNLHSTVQNNVSESREATEAPKMRPRIVVVENSGRSYNAPTRKDLLVFKKERSHHRASEKKQFERLANEVRAENE